MHGQGLGGTKIAKELNRKGISTPSGRGLWQQSTIRKLITGKHVLGILTTADGTDHHGYFPQVIDEEMWLEANVMAGSGQATKSRNKPKPLAGIVQCKCGASMRHQSRTGRMKRDGTRNRWDYFVCAKAAVGGNCPFISVAQDTVLSCLDAELKGIYQYAIHWSGETPTYEAKKLALQLAQEDLAASYELYKAVKSATARARTAEFEKLVYSIQKEVEELARAANDAGNNLVRTLLEAPRTRDNVWWRQFAKRIIVDTIEMQIEIHFHNGQTYSLCIEPDKYIDPGDVINGASLLDLLKNE